MGCLTCTRSRQPGRTTSGTCRQSGTRRDTGRPLLTWPGSMQSTAAQCLLLSTRAGGSRCVNARRLLGALVGKQAKTGTASQSFKVVINEQAPEIVFCRDLSVLATCHNIRRCCVIVYRAV